MFLHWYGHYETDWLVGVMLISISVAIGCFVGEHL